MSHGYLGGLIKRRAKKPERIYWNKFHEDNKKLSASLDNMGCGIPRQRLFGRGKRRAAQ